MNKTDKFESYSDTVWMHSEVDPLTLWHVNKIMNKTDKFESYSDTVWMHSEVDPLTLWHVNKIMNKTINCVEMAWMTLKIEYVIKFMKLQSYLDHTRNLK
jgi:hypothetical protein